MSACAPYGYDYDSNLGPTVVQRAVCLGQHGSHERAAVSLTDTGLRGIATHPNTTVDWSKYEPLTATRHFIIATRRLIPRTTRSRLSMSFTKEPFSISGMWARRRIICST